VTPAWTSSAVQPDRERPAGGSAGRSAVRRFGGAPP
jgi:hypothetical protein